jgi:hypothetical protein
MMEIKRASIYLLYRLVKTVNLVGSILTGVICESLAALCDSLRMEGFIRAKKLDETTIIVKKLPPQLDAVKNLPFAWRP